LEEWFVPENAQDERFIFQYSFTSTGGGDYYVSVGDGAARVLEGVHDNPHLKFTAGAKDNIMMGSGELGGLKTLFAKKLRTAGKPVGPARILNSFQCARVSDLAGSGNKCSSFNLCMVESAHGLI
jgi:hypothetical protein